MQTGSFTSHSSVVTLSWNLEGTRLLTGGTNIQLWKSKSPTHQPEEEHTGESLYCVRIRLPNNYRLDVSEERSSVASHLQEFNPINLNIYWLFLHSPFVVESFCQQIYVSVFGINSLEELFSVSQFLGFCLGFRFHFLAIRLKSIRVTVKTVIVYRYLFKILSRTIRLNTGTL